MKFKVGDKVKLTPRANMNGAWEIRAVSDYGYKLNYTYRHGQKDIWEDIYPENDLKCDHQWKKIARSPFFQVMCSQCQELDDFSTNESGMMGPNKKPEVKVGQEWEWNRGSGTGNVGVVRTTDVSGGKVDYDYIDGRLGYPKEIDFFLKELRLIKDVPTYFGIPPWLGALEEPMEENPTGEFIDYNFKIERDKLEKAKTNLEEKAYEEARQEVIDSCVEQKAIDARAHMVNYVDMVNEVKSLREKADAIEKEAAELATVLGVTDEDKDQLFN